MTETKQRSRECRRNGVRMSTVAPISTAEMIARLLSDDLRLMARALAELVKKIPKLDWRQRESVE
jgi:hypothetical protein